MSLKKKIASALAAGAIALGSVMLAAPAAEATGNPSRLDRGDLTSQCRLQYGAAGWDARLMGNTAYSWRCVYNNNYNDQRSVNVNSYCQYYWSVWAVATNANDPYSWKCQGY